VDRILASSLALFGALSALATSSYAEEAAAPAARPDTEEAAPGDRPPPEWGLLGPYRFEIGASIGYAHRATSSPVFADTSDAGLTGGIQLRLFTSERVGFGLGYQHLGLWHESSGVLSTGTFELGRRLDTVLASLRLRPLYGETFGAFVDMGVGPSFQGVSLTGAAWSPVTPGARVPVSCSGSGAVGFAFRAQAGVEARITDSFRTELGVGVDLFRHTDGLVGNCAPGVGATVAPGAQLGFLYGWGL